MFVQLIESSSDDEGDSADDDDVDVDSDVSISSSIREPLHQSTPVRGAHLKVCHFLYIAVLAYHLIAGIRCAIDWTFYPTQIPRQGFGRVLASHTVA